MSYVACVVSGSGPALALGTPGEGISVLIARSTVCQYTSVAWITSLPGAGYCQLIHSTDNHTLQTQRLAITEHQFTYLTYTLSGSGHVCLIWKMQTE